MTPQGQRASFDVYRFVEDGKTIRGSNYGSADPRRDFPSIAEGVSRGPAAARRADLGAHRPRGARRRVRRHASRRWRATSDRVLRRPGPDLAVQAKAADACGQWPVPPRRSLGGGCSSCAPFDRPSRHHGRLWPRPWLRSASRASAFAQLARLALGLGLMRSASRSSLADLRARPLSLGHPLRWLPRVFLRVLDPRGRSPRPRRRSPST